MQYIFWIMGGFFLMYLANGVEAYGDLGASPGARLPFYFTALAMLIAGLFCFFKGWRGAMRAIREQKSGGTPSPQPQPDTAIPASRLDEPESSTSFDVDGAFERYMQNRVSEPAAPTADRAPTKEQLLQPRRRTSFGRKSS